MSELPEKRFGGNGQSAVVGAAKRAALVRKRRSESRRGGRSRLWNIRIVGVSACTGRASSGYGSRNVLRLMSHVTCDYHTAPNPDITIKI
jgi:hypothetical protein